MLFSGGACSRRVSLSLKPFSFPRRCAKLERERERVGSWERAGEFCRRRCFVLCGMPREGGEGKKDRKVFLGNEEETRRIFFNFFSIFFSSPLYARRLSRAFAFYGVAKCPDEWRKIIV